MKPTKETPIPELDLLLLRAGYPVAENEKYRAIQSQRMYHARCRLCRTLAKSFHAIAKWLDKRAGDLRSGIAEAA